MASHSPLPWRVLEERGDVWIVDANNVIVFSGMDRDGHFAPNGTYYPEFIVTAVNAHADLLAALRAILAVDEPCACWGDCGCDFAAAKAIAEAAIVRAEHQ